MVVNEAGASDGRRLTRRGQQTRTRIVAAAAELMFENGVAETTLEDIRAAAGVSGSQVYHYFEDKQALVRAVIDYQADAVLDAQDDHLNHLDTVPGLRAWRDFLVEHQRRLGCRGGCPIGALGAEVAETDAVSRLAAARGLRRWEERIREGFQAMPPRGDLPLGPDPPPSRPCPQWHRKQSGSQRSRPAQPSGLGPSASIETVPSRTVAPGPRGIRTGRRRHAASPGVLGVIV